MEAFMADEVMETPTPGAPKPEHKAPSQAEKTANEIDFYSKSAVAAAIPAATGLLGGLERMLMPLSQQIALMGKKDATLKDKISRGLFGVSQTPAVPFIAQNSVQYGSALASTLSLDQGLATGAVSLAAMPLMAAAYYPVGYFLGNNYSFKGIGESLKKNFKSTAARTTVAYGTPVALATAYAPQFLWPAAGLGNIIYNFWNGYKNQPEKDKKAFLPYTIEYGKTTVSNATAPLVGAASLARKTNYQIQNIGIALREMYRHFVEALTPEAPKAAGTAAPAAAPAH